MTATRPLVDIVRVALALALVGLAVLTPTTAADAHAYLVSSSPANGETVEGAPAAVEVVLSEPVTLLERDDAVSVLDTAGERVDTGRVTRSDDGATLTIPLRGDLPDGVYLATWSVISADTHPMGGSIQFGVNVPASVSAPADGSTDAALATAQWGAKSAVYVGLVLALGAPAAARLLGLPVPRRRALRPLALAGAALAVVGSVAQLFAQFVSTQVGGAATGGIDASQLVPFLGSAYAVAVGVRLVALVLVAAVAAVETRLRTPVAFVLWAVAAVAASATVAVNGHAGLTPVRLATATAHASAAIAWLGGLVVLAVVLLRRRESLVDARALGVWSLYAGSAVAVLVVSGLVQALWQVGFTAALWSTTYGLVLCAKLLLVVAALVLGALGFRWARTRAPSNGRVRRRIVVEAGAAALALVLSGLLTSITPAVAEYSPTVVRETRIGPYQVTLTVTNARVGSQTLQVRTVGGDDDVAPATASIRLDNEAAGVAGLTAELPHRATEAVALDEPLPARFRSDPLSIPVSGVWTATVTLVVDEWEQYTGEVTYTTD